MLLRKLASRRWLVAAMLIITTCVWQLASTQGAPTPPASHPETAGSQSDQSQELGNRSESSNVGQIIDIENQIADRRAQIRSLVRLSSLITVFLHTRDTFNKAFENAKLIDCGRDAGKLQSDFDNIQNTVIDWYAISQGMREQGKVLRPFFSEWWQANDQKKCEELQNANLRQQGLAGFNEIEAEAKQNSDEIETLSKEISHLYAQRDDAIGSQTTIRNITAALPYILAIIAGFALAIMILMYFYKEDIQMEWVASGQVTQFVTVMILLSALMVLGLTGVLHEQVLGTLLGGVAGYVLAQGIGRAAARSTLTAATATVPYPPAAPTPQVPPSAPPQPAPPQRAGA
jgi:hypothetical protein